LSGDRATPSYAYGAAGAPVRCSWLLAPVLVAVLAGCGSSGPTDSPTAAGLGAAAQRLVSDVETGHFSQACEAFTAQARAVLNRYKGGCAGFLAQASPVLLKQMHMRFHAFLPEPQIVGAGAYYLGALQARYEGGDWHFENAVW